MAYRKQCDYDGSELGMDGNAYLQLHGSLSEQIESPDGKGIEWRFLTPYSNTKLAFCTSDCLNKWIEQQQQNTPYQQREVIPRRNVY